MQLLLLLLIHAHTNPELALGSKCPAATRGWGILSILRCSLEIAEIPKRLE